jgi:hypothetical protein
MYRFSLLLVRLTVVFAFIVILFTQSSVFELERQDQVHTYTRMVEFEYVSWTLDAFYTKFVQAALSTSHFLTADQNKQIVKTCVSMVTDLDHINNQIDQIYSDPKVSNPGEASAALTKQRDQIKTRQSQLQPLCEDILQQQVGAVLKDWGLTTGGQTLPPLLYHVTPLPLALITSPRDKIVQEQDISLLADLKIEDQTRLEKQVEEGLNVSALVVPVGGIGIYPTMVLSVDDLPWQANTISHEWTHNYLTLRPLGLNYETTPELRTMNETTASIVGKEVGDEVIRRYYPELAPPPPAPVDPQKKEQPKPEQPQTPPPFNFNKEMHTTRITAEALLKEGKIKEAEDYMEQRRKFMWDNGYQIRRLNQAYFAFYGAYADVPGGAAGNDPVGPAVVLLRKQSASLADFLNRISWMSSFDELKKAVHSP